MGASLRRLAEGYPLLLWSKSWVFFRSRPPWMKVNTLPYQPSSTILSDFDCGVVSTYFTICNRICKDAHLRMIWQKEYLWQIFNLLLCVRAFVRSCVRAFVRMGWMDSIYLLGFMAAVYGMMMVGILRSIKLCVQWRRTFQVLYSDQIICCACCTWNSRLRLPQQQ